MNNQYDVGIDIGGTKVNIGLISSKGEIVDHQVILTDKEEALELFIGHVADTLKNLCKKNNVELSQISFVGIGVPGTVDMPTGVVEYCPNLQWENIPLKSMFEKVLPGLRIGIIQDSWAGAIAEHAYGVGKGVKNMACVTLGTGIGCGLIIHDKIFPGGMHCAGEIGHIIVQKDGIPCSCGRRGCLERYASGTGIFEQAYELFPEKFIGREHRAETVFEFAEEGYQPAKGLIDESVRMLGLGLANLVGITSIEKIAISGGLCCHEELIVEPLRKYIVEYGYHAWTRQNKLSIEVAEVGPNAPMLGAAIMYRAM